MFILYPIAIVGAFLLVGGLVGIRTLNLLSAFDSSIMMLVTFRIIRLFTLDKIFGFAGAIFMDTLADGTAVKPAGGFRRAIAERMECQWRTGVRASCGCRDGESPVLPGGVRLRKRSNSSIILTRTLSSAG